MPQIEVRMVFDSLADMQAVLGAQAAVQAPPTPQVETETPEKPAARRGRKKAEPAPEPQAKTETPAPETPAESQPEAAGKPLTKEDATAALMKVNDVKGMPGSRAVLQKFGVDRISAVPADRYAEFIAACEQEVA